MVSSIVRVDSLSLRQEAQNTVRLVGKVLQCNKGQTALLEACDRGQVLVNLNPDTEYHSKYVEVTGLVAADGQSLQEMWSVPFGDNFGRIIMTFGIYAAVDLSLYAEFMKYYKQFPDLFLTSLPSSANTTSY